MFFSKKNKEVKNNPSIEEKELDIVELPIEAVAAYWLSLKKVCGTKWKKAVSKEANYTSEPFIKYILDLILSSFSDDLIRKYAKFKMKTYLKEFQRNFVIISIGLLGISVKENPQQVLIRIMSKFPLPPTSDVKLFKEAQSLVANVDNGKKPFVEIYHGLHPEILIKNILFYSILSRRKGVDFSLRYCENVRSPFFKEGLRLIIDGFDAEFIKYRLNLQQREILYETEQKMNMSIEMAICLRNKVPYEDMFKVANSFLI